MFTIKDELAGTFGNLMCINPKVKNRTFKWITAETEKSDCDDKRIYKLGTYDTETGEIKEPDAGTGLQHGAGKKRR